MSKTTLSVLFKKQQRDDKKEVLLFEYKGSDDNKENKDAIPDSLFLLAGELVLIEFPNTDIGKMSAEFSKLNKDSKKTTLEFHLKGDSETKAIKTYQYAGQNVTLSIEPSQQDLTEVDNKLNDHEGMEYAVDLSGNVDLKSKLDKPKEVAKGEEKKEELPFTDDEPGNLEDDDLPL